MAVEDAGVTTRLDAVIIGTGQAGKPLAGALAEAGWRVAIIERDRVGGTCLIRGCTPTKTMVASARVAHIARRSGDYGVQAGPVSVNMAQVRARKRDVVDSFSESAEKGMTRHATLELVFGEAAFVDTHTIDVHVADGGSRRFEAPRIFVNTGTRPQVPALDGLDTVRFLDSTSIMELSEVPDHLLILGGGFIGLEFAQMFRRFGARVTVVEQHARIAGMEDDDVADALMELLQEDGIAFHAGTTARSVAATGGAVSLEVEKGRSDDAAARIAPARCGGARTEHRGAPPGEGGHRHRRARLHQCERQAGDECRGRLRTRRGEWWPAVHPRGI
jgi:pyruvate/2-oxoglutarate dehydrogenase complex dihydrolipoamide dehydrogenase (E3) component